MKYNRILLKLSGESLMGKQSYGIACVARRHDDESENNAEKQDVQFGCCHK